MSDSEKNLRSMLLLQYDWGHFRLAWHTVCLFFTFFKKGTFPFPLSPCLNIYSSNCSFGIFFVDDCVTMLKSWICANGGGLQHCHVQQTFHISVFSCLSQPTPIHLCRVSKVYQTSTPDFPFSIFIFWKRSLYGVFTHVPTNLFAFNILTVLSINWASFKPSLPHL